MQGNFQVSSSMSELQSIVVSIVKRHSHRRSNEEVIAEMECNIGQIGCVQKKHLDEAKQLHSGEDVRKHTSLI